MTDIANITSNDLLHHLKLSYQIPAIAEEIISRRIIAHTAEEAKISIESEELQQAADQFRLAAGLHTAAATWQWLQEHQLSLDDFEETIRATLLGAKLAEHLFADQVEAFFVEHQLDYAQVVLYEVMFDNKDAAMEVFYAIQEGEISFHEVARQSIQDTELRRIGGYRGALTRMELKAEIAAISFAASPPQVLKPIVTAVGVHLILIEELIEPKLDDDLKQIILSQLFSTWLKQQLSYSVNRASKQSDFFGNELSENMNAANA